MLHVGQAIVTPRPWGYFATTGWFVLAVLISLALVGSVVEWLDPEAFELSDVDSDIRLLPYFATIWSGTLLAVLALAARLRRWSIKDYFGLARPSNREMALGLAALAMQLAAEQTVDYLTDWGRESAKYIINLYVSARAAGMQPLVWLMFELVIAAPVMEEMIFRGFLYRGWAKAPRGVVPAILVISALFALVHIQYNWFGVFAAFSSGLVYGWARWWSGSTLLAVLLHVLTNLWALITTAVYVEWLS